MKKKYSILFILLITMISLSSCKKANLVEITFPAYFFQGQDMDVIQKQAKEDNINDVIIEEDGTVIYKMTEEERLKLLAKTKKEIEDSVEALLKDKSNYPSIEDVSFNKDMTKFTVLVDKSTFNDGQAVSSIALFIQGGLYQAINGVSSEKIDTRVDFVDKETKEVFDSGTLLDLLETVNDESK